MTSNYKNKEARQRLNRPVDKQVFQMRRCFFSNRIVQVPFALFTQTKSTLSAFFKGGFGIG